MENSDNAFDENGAPVVVPIFSRVNRLRYHLGIYSEELDDLHRRIRAGEFSKLKDQEATAKQVLSASKTLTEAETKVEENLLKQAGKLSHNDIDFDELRAAVRGRLARLRNT